MCIHHSGELSPLTPAGFLAEVSDFRERVGNKALTPSQRKHALDVIVMHAATLDPADPGFAGAGVALKEALCSWLDAQSSVEH